MLYFVTKSKAGTKEYTWHLGRPLPQILGADLTEIQADGDELRAIQRTFGDTIPMTDQPVMNWFGDFARVIYAAMRSK